jgi:hypothetical protein
MALGFTHLSDKQMDSIFQRADKDGNMELDFEVCGLWLVVESLNFDHTSPCNALIALSHQEFMAEAPRTLRTNLVLMAKTNGDDLGFLS